MLTAALTPEQISPLADIVAVANTPAYLFKHFANDPNVRALSRQNSADDLLAYARDAANCNPLTFDNTVVAYAGLIAAILRPLKEFANATSHDGAAPKFRWAADILNMRHAAHTANTSQVIVAGSPAMTSISTPGTRTMDPPKFEVIVSRGRV